MFLYVASGLQEMHSACDIEGHKGKDNRHYLLDFARSFPPESPFKVCMGYRLFNSQMGKIGETQIASIDQLISVSHVS